jgi:hypothetical protein
MRAVKALPFLAVVLFAAVLAPPTMADPRSPAPPATDRPNAVHCAYRLKPIGPDPDTPGATLASPVLIGCFRSASDSIFAGTGGAVRLPESLAGSALTQENLNRYGAAAASSFLIGREYNSINYANLLKEYFVGSACTNSSGWTVSYVGDALNDRFESGKGFSNCDHNYKYEHSGFRGARRHCSPNCADYGVLRNEVSSLKWLGYTI